MIIQLTNANCCIDKHIKLILVEEVVNCVKVYYFKLKCPAKYKILNECVLINNIVIKLPSIIDCNGTIFEICELPTLTYKNLEIHTDYIDALVNVVDGYYWIQLETSDTYTENGIYIKDFCIMVKPTKDIESIDKMCVKAGDLMHIKGN